MRKIFNSNSGSRGFTLLELLVVVAIIGFLSSVSIVALSASQSNSRDTQRKLDQVSIIKAVELYKNDFGVYPTQVKPEKDGGVSFGETENGIASAPETPSEILKYFTPIPSAKAVGVGPGSQCPGAARACPQGQSWVGYPDCDCVVDLPGPGDGGGSSDCNGNFICEPENGENIGSCASDCQLGGDGGIGGGPGGSNKPGGVLCGNNQCNVGESPATCAEDCTNYGMCYVSGEWNLCCLFGGSYCGSDGQAGGAAATSGYYGACNGDRCEVRYFLEKPAVTCSAETAQSVCAPGSGLPGTNNQDKFVGEGNSNWLVGLDRYMVKLPQDPGHKQARPSDPPEVQTILNSYWATSHPAIVKDHGFCVFVALEAVGDNINPYSEDIKSTPTGDLDSRWTILCAQ